MIRYMQLRFLYRTQVICHAVIWVTARTKKGRIWSTGPNSDLFSSGFP